MRAAVAYSIAEKVEEAEQRKANQISHNQAMELADGAPNILKELERTHRRIERLIEKLAARAVLIMTAPAASRIRNG